MGPSAGSAQAILLSSWLLPLSRTLVLLSCHKGQCVLFVGSADLEWCGRFLVHLSVIPADHLVRQLV